MFDQKNPSSKYRHSVICKAVCYLCLCKEDRAHSSELWWFIGKEIFFLWNDGNDGDMCGRWEHVAPSLFHLIFRKRAEVAQESGEMQGTSLWVALFSPSVQWHSNGALKYSGTMVFQIDCKWSPPKNWKQKIYVHLYTSQLRYIYITSHIVKITLVSEQWGTHEECSTSQAQWGF